MIYNTYKENPPGLILGPYEALIAMISWLREELPQNGYDYGPISKLAVSPQMKEQLLMAYLLYGKFDVITALGFFDSYLQGKGFIESRRELVGDYLSDLTHSSPFCHSLEIGYAWPILQSPPKLDSIDESTIASTCYRAMNRAGIRGYKPLEPGVGTIPLRIRLKEAANNITYCNANGLQVVPHASESALLSLLYAIDRSVNLSIPFYSCDAAAPAWIRKEHDTENCILRVLFEEVDWLPRPCTFKEAYLMAQDERIIGLRTYIKTLTEKTTIGDLDLQETLREKIKKDVRTFRGKPWASRVAKFIAYAAVPAEIAGLICNAHMVGVSVASLGATCEWMASICSKKKNKHWLSITKLPKYTK